MKKKTPKTKARKPAGQHCAVVLEKPNPRWQKQAKVEQRVAKATVAAKTTEAIPKVDMMSLDNAGQMEAIFRSAPDAVGKVVGKAYHDDYSAVRAKTTPV